MPNTRSAAKRTKQNIVRNDRNRAIRSDARTALRRAMEAIGKKDAEAVKVEVGSAIRILTKAATKGAFPKTRAARKVSRLVKLAQKQVGGSLPFGLQK